MNLGATRGHIREVGQALAESLMCARAETANLQREFVRAQKDGFLSGAARSHARELVDIMTRACGVSRELSSHYVVFCRDLELILDVARKLAHNLDRDSDFDRDFDWLERYWQLVVLADEGLSVVLKRLSITQANSHHNPVMKPAPPRRTVRPTAARLLTLATRWLPPAEQERYTEEYRTELWEIAAGGQGYRCQILYAARQVASSLRLRRELRVPRRRSAAR